VPGAGSRRSLDPRVRHPPRPVADPELAGPGLVEEQSIARLRLRVQAVEDAGAAAGWRGREPQTWSENPSSPASCWASV
jgi:hypothetical protein